MPQLQISYHVHILLKILYNLGKVILLQRAESKDDSSALLNSQDLVLSASCKVD